jgi:hypothetical protein
MKWRLTMGFLGGFAAAVVLGAIGTVIGIRRNVMIADEEATISLPIEEDALAPAR